MSRLVCRLAALFIAASTLSPALAQEQAVDHILVLKKDHVMLLLRDGQPVKRYRIALGRSPVGSKLREGDNRTPEGVYHIMRKKADSLFHRALQISYPNDDDLTAARQRGDDPGGNIMIHGLPGTMLYLGESHWGVDWTAGCIAVTNKEIDEIWQLVPVGTPVEIRP